MAIAVGATVVVAVAVVSAGEVVVEAVVVL